MSGPLDDADPVGQSRAAIVMNAKDDQARQSTQQEIKSEQEKPNAYIYDYRRL